MKLSDGEPLERSALGPGVVIADRYRLADRIGDGGMGSVWRATHVTLAHDVAIKFLHRSEMSGRGRARFEREARLAARLGEASRYITRVIDHGVYRETQPYLVMELLIGETLSARARRQRMLPLALTARWIRQLCRALQVAHGAGVIHRDLKPSNIFLARTEFDDEALVKLMDFGVAKSTAENEESETTSAGTIIGTPGYMSPEQILCKRLDARTDLWGVAACVYRLTTGRMPFGQGGVAELGLRILATDPPAPSSINPALPRELDAWMAKALSKNTEDRFQSARDLADALSVIADNRAVDASAPALPVPLPEEPPEPPSISSISIREASEPITRHDRPAPVVRRKPRVSPSILALAGALAVGIGIERMRTIDRATAAPRAMAAAQATTRSSASAPRAPIAPPAASSTAPPIASSSAPPAPKPPPVLKAHGTKKVKAPSLAVEAELSWTKMDEL